MSISDKQIPGLRDIHEPVPRIEGLDILLLGIDEQNLFDLDEDGEDKENKEILSISDSYLSNDSLESIVIYFMTSKPDALFPFLKYAEKKGGQQNNYSRSPWLSDSCRQRINEVSDQDDLTQCILSDFTLYSENLENLNEHEENEKQLNFGQSFFNLYLENDETGGENELHAKNEVSCCDLYRVNNDFSKIVLTDDFPKTFIPRIEITKTGHERQKQSLDCNYPYQANLPLQNSFDNVYSRALAFLNCHDLSLLLRTPLQVQVYQRLVQMSL